MTRTLASLLCAALLNAAAGPLAFATALRPVAPWGPEGRQDGPVASLRDALEDALVQASDADGRALAVQALENDALDLGLSRGRRSAAGCRRFAAPPRLPRRLGRRRNPFFPDSDAVGGG